MSQLFHHSLTQVRDLLRTGEISVQDATSSPGTHRRDRTHR